MLDFQQDYMFINKIKWIRSCLIPIIKYQNQKDLNWFDIECLISKSTLSWTFFDNCSYLSNGSLDPELPFRDKHSKSWKLCLNSSLSLNSMKSAGYQNSVRLDGRYMICSSSPPVRIRKNIRWDTTVMSK